jgi:monomeric sarcosine oxidase
VVKNRIVNDPGADHLFDRIVVGGGAMGLATTWQLAKRGFRVLMIERFLPGHQNGASHGAARNLNSAYSEEHYLDLYEESVALYRELEQESGERLLTLCGLITHGDDDEVERVAEAHRRRRIDSGILTPVEAARRWPGMRFDAKVLFSADAGRVRADQVLGALARESEKLGAVLLWGHRVDELRVLGEDRVRIVATAQDRSVRRFEAHGAVVTAGAWTEALLAQLPDIARDLPALRVTEEHPAHFQLRAGADGGLLEKWPSFNHLLPESELGTGPIGIYGMWTPGEGVKVGFHRAGDVVDPEDRPHTVSPALRDALLGYVAASMPALDPTTAEWVSCTYTSTPSQRFILDRRGPLTIGAGFSGHGFKFVPAVGRVLARASLGEAAPAAEWRLENHRATA